MQHMSQFTIVCAVIVGVMATARLTRLVVFDTYPPMAWIRNQWRRLVGNSEWSKLVDCPYCAAPYLAAGVLAAGELSDYGLWWWIVCGWLGASYVAAIVVRFDGDD